MISAQKPSFLATMLIASGLVVPLPAAAVTQNKVYEFSAADACQLSVPTTDTKVRPRAAGYRNEGTTNQFVICGMGGYENSTVYKIAVLYSSIDGVARSMSCTGVTGLVGFDGPYYSSKTANVPASGFSFTTWTAGDFGGIEGNPIEYGGNLSFTCTLPPGVALQGLEAQATVDVGS